MFKLYEEVYLWGNNNRKWTVVGISEDTVCATDNLPMIKIVSNGELTFAKQSELVKCWP